MQTDVLIIGGGPAGSSLAWALRDSGLDVTVMDKQAFPRQKVCAGWVTPAVMNILDVDVDDYARRHILQPITGFRIAMIDQRAVQSHFPGEPVSYGIRRIEFDYYLLLRSGARLLLHTPLREMRRRDDGWRVNDEIDTRLVIGAGGHFCPVARAIGARIGSELAVAAQEIEFRMSARQRAVCAVEGPLPELFFTPDLMGYGWVFRKGDYLNIGLGREDRHRLPGHVAAFCDYLRESGRVTFDLSGKFNGHAYLLYPHARRKILGDRVLLVGDAAGLAYARSGEGIRPAVESALLAAGVITACDGDYSPTGLQAYGDRLQARFGAREPGPGLMDRLPTGLKQACARGLMKTRWFTRSIVTERWFLQSRLDPLPGAGGSIAG